MTSPKARSLSEDDATTTNPYNPLRDRGRGADFLCIRVLFIQDLSMKERSERISECKVQCKCIFKRHVKVVGSAVGIRGMQTVTQV